MRNANNTDIIQTMSVNQIGISNYGDGYGYGYGNGDGNGGIL
jgi:hypothetical protein